MTYRKLALHPVSRIMITERSFLLKRVAGADLRVSTLFSQSIKVARTEPCGQSLDQSSPTRTISPVILYTSGLEMSAFVSSLSPNTLKNEMAARTII